MFKRFKPATPPELKPDDERIIEEDARTVIVESREQIERARDILEKEVSRLDYLLTTKR